MYTKESIINSIQEYYKNTSKIPTSRDFQKLSGYPGATTVQRYFGNWNKAIEEAGLISNTPTYATSYTKEYIINSIQEYYKNNKVVPSYRDFQNNKDYPNSSTIKNYFGSWNNAIQAAGFQTNVADSYGIPTYGLDGHLYRSRAEAKFCDKFLYLKYNYEIETKYPDPYYKFYDWFIPSIDLYIELDGGIRPTVIKEKIEINKIFNRNCLFIKTSAIANKDSLSDFNQL